jgi:hypothetical protein
MPKMALLPVFKGRKIGQKIPLNSIFGELLLCRRTVGDSEMAAGEF